MKYFLFFIITLSFTCFAEYKVPPITNKVTGQSFCYPNGCYFESEKEAKNWVKKQKKEQSWGKLARKITFLPKEDPKPGFDSCVDVVIDKDGNEDVRDGLVGVVKNGIDAIGFADSDSITVKRCNYPDEFDTPEIQDVTIEMTAKKDEDKKAKDKRKKILKKLKNKNADLNDIQEVLEYLIKREIKE